jgi:hypothetical protein
MKCFSRIRSTVLALTMALATAGCMWGTLTPEEFEARQVHGICGAAFQPNGMTPTFVALREAAGPSLRATSAVVYPDYATFELRDPANPGHLNDWFVRGTTVDPSSAVSVSTGDDLDGRTFSLTEYPWDDLPHALAEGLRVLSLESGTVRYINISRDGPGNTVQTRAAFGGPRESGNVVFNQSLKVISTTRH